MSEIEPSTSFCIKTQSCPFYRFYNLPEPDRYLLLCSSQMARSEQQVLSAADQLSVAHPKEKERWLAPSSIFYRCHLQTIRLVLYLQAFHSPKKSAATNYIGECVKILRDWLCENCAWPHINFHLNAVPSLCCDGFKCSCQKYRRRQDRP